MQVQQEGNKLHTGNLQLTAVHLMMAQSCNGKSNLLPVLALMTIAPPLWVRDHSLGAWQISSHLWPVVAIRSGDHGL